MTDYTLDELKDMVSLEEVLIECGARFVNDWSRTEQPFFCPFHYNVNTPAASMNTMKAVFHCYSCGAAGSVIDAAMLHLGAQSVRQATEWLVEEFILD